MDGWNLMEHAAELARRGEAFALATVVWRHGPSSGKEGCRAIITADGELHGWIGGACAEPLRRAEQQQPCLAGADHVACLADDDRLGAGATDPPVQLAGGGDDRA